MNAYHFRRPILINLNFDLSAAVSSVAYGGGQWAMAPSSENIFCSIHQTALQ